MRYPTPVYSDRLVWYTNGIYTRNECYSLSCCRKNCQIFRLGLQKTLSNMSVLWYLMPLDTTNISIFCFKVLCKRNFLNSTRGVSPYMIQKRCPLEHLHNTFPSETAPLAKFTIKYRSGGIQLSAHAPTVDVAFYQ